MKTIFAIIGSANKPSSNHAVINYISSKIDPTAFQLITFDRLKELPPFDPDESINQPPIEIIALRQIIQDADIVLFASPEYASSIPSGLKNLIEWCVATPVFDRKPVAIITAATQGAYAHDELQLILKTLNANLQPEQLLLLSGIKGKIDQEGYIWDPVIALKLDQLLSTFK